MAIAELIMLRRLTIILLLEVTLIGAARAESEDDPDAWRAEIAKVEKQIVARVEIDRPDGEYYEATVPDTLDLAGRGSLALNCLIGMAAGPEYDFEAYLSTNFAARPVVMSHNPFLPEGGFGGFINQPKMLEALPLSRLMSGGRSDLNVEHEMMTRMLAMSWDDGFLYTPPAETRPWLLERWEHMVHMPLIPRFMLSVLYYYEITGDDIWLEHAQKMYRSLNEKVIRREDGRALLPTLAGNNLPQSGIAADTPYTDKAIDFGIFTFGNMIRALCKYYQVTGDAEALELAGELAKTARGAQLWQSPYTAPGIVGHERGIFYGHFHSQTSGLRGLLAYAEATNDEDLRQFVRQGYEYCRLFGISEIGYFPEGLGSTNGEGCCVADMVSLAQELCRANVGDYWDDLEIYTRNGLVEWQLVDLAQLRNASEAGRKIERVSTGQTDDNALQRSVGSFAANPYVTDFPNPWNYCCCSHNGAQALYAAWEGIVQDLGDGTAQVNMLLNRASALVDVDSYLPHEGKAVIRIKRARRVHVRIPGWVERSAVECFVDGDAIAPVWLGRYVIFSDVAGKHEIRIQFPVREWTIHRTEGASGKRYAITYRGNTVVDVSPRDEEQSVRIEDGELVVERPIKLVSPGLTIRDVTIGVDAHADQDAAVLVRYLNIWTYLVAYYSHSESAIYFGEMRGGLYEPGGKTKLKAPLSGRITLTATLKGDTARMSVTDGKTTGETEYSILQLHDPGQVGIYASRGEVGQGIGANSPYRQRYDNFTVKDGEGSIVLYDSFDNPENSPSGLHAGGSSNYRFYLRDGLRNKETPMARVTRFAPAHEIRH